MCVIFFLLSLFMIFRLNGKSTYYTLFEMECLRFFLLHDRTGDSSGNR